ncbi:hypothetical protein [Rosenbergiella epipactidis]|uniref:hypothetical protein n=1 Tax=Rosenbergiella epipactidis TaxID=1544694 RepID=UPI001F4E9B27|nr:hypothetical protein [Rosenbergiella epipactidis]
MRLSFFIPMMLLPTFAFAQTSLQVTSDTPFKKNIFHKALEKTIQGGMPVNSQTFTLTRNGKVLGTFIAGKGFNEQDDNVCFIGWSVQNTVVKTIIPTIGYDDWQAESCRETKAVGVISSAKEKETKIAVIYKAASPNTLTDETIVFSVESANSTLYIDRALTKKLSTSGATTLAEVKKALTQ